MIKNGRGLFSEVLLMRIQSAADAIPVTTELMSALDQRVRVHESGTEMIDDAQASTQPRFVTQGWAYRSVILPDGRRQIFSFILPGDLICFRGDGRPFARAPVTALTKVATISAAPFFELAARSSREQSELSAAVEALMRMEELHILDHVVRLGCQSALEKLSHLILELHDRLHAIGFVHQGSFSLPISQELVGHMLGLSLVHVNRTLREMKKREIIVTRGKTVTVLDRDQLAFTAGFYPATSCWEKDLTSCQPVTTQMAV